MTTQNVTAVTRDVTHALARSLDALQGSKKHVLSGCSALRQFVL